MKTFFIFQIWLLTLSPKFSSQDMRTTRKQTMKQGTAMAKGASGPRARFSAKKLARIPAMMAEIGVRKHQFFCLNRS